MVSCSEERKEDEREDVRIFIKSRVTDAGQAADEIVAEEEKQSVVGEPGVAEPETKDHQVGEEVGRVEDRRVDEDGPQDRRVVYWMVDRRIQRHYLVVHRTHHHILDP